MRRSLVAALVAMVLMTWPAYAQLFPPTPTPGGPPAPIERVLMDATVWIRPPGEPILCLALEAGQLTVTARRTNDVGVQRPTSFQFYGFMADPDASIKLQVGPEEVTGATRVIGADHYCWQIKIDAPETKNMSSVELGGYIQQIALKITFQP